MWRLQLIEISSSARFDSQLTAKLHVPGDTHVSRAAARLCSGTSPGLPVATFSPEQPLPIRQLPELQNRLADGAPRVDVLHRELTDTSADPEPATQGSSGGQRSVNTTPRRFATWPAAQRV